MQFSRHYGYKTDIWAPRGPRRKRAPLPPHPRTPTGSEGAPFQTQSGPTQSSSSDPASASALGGPSGGRDNSFQSLHDQLVRLLPFTEACRQAAAGSQTLTVVDSGGIGAKYATMAVAEAAVRYQKTCEFSAKVWRSLVEYVYDRCATLPS